MHFHHGSAAIPEKCHHLAVCHEEPPVGLGHELATLTLSSSRLKPLPARTFVWYLTVRHLTTGRRGPDAGRGTMRRALACRALCLRILRAGWLNHVATRRCQSLWKWGFRIMPFRLCAMAAAERPPPRAHGQESPDKVLTPNSSLRPLPPDTPSALPCHPSGGVTPPPLGNGE